MAKRLVIKRREPLPVYDTVKECIDAKPELSATLPPEQLEPLRKLGLLEPSSKLGPLEPSSKLGPSQSPHISRLLEDYRNADKMTQEELKSALTMAERQYYLAVEGGAILPDTTYDYAKRIYNQRALCLNDKKLTMRNVSSATGVGATTRGQDTALPTPLWSMDNLFKGEGDVQTWARRAPGPYLVTAKMDGVSALYWEGRLYTRGDGLTGRDISHVLRYIKVPANARLHVRGEIVIDRRLFDSKYRGRTGRSNTRNSVSGALGAIQNIDKEFISDLSFVAYEVIVPGKDALQTSPSEQYRQLEAEGWLTAAHTSMPAIDDASLSAHYSSLLEDYSFDIDGLVVYQDRPYNRELQKNPDYAKAYKEALECLLAVTTVKNVEWNVSKDGYMIPTVVYEPVTICGVRLGRATGESARFIMNNGIGPGAKIEVIYHAKVNPRVERVIERAADTSEAALLPKLAYRWVGGDAKSGPVHIVFNDDSAGEGVPASVDEIRQTIDIKRIYKFLVDIGAKGIGETTVKKIYDSGLHSIRDFINMTRADIVFLGDTLSKNIIDSIKTALREADLAVLMASSGVFGRGMGVRKLAKIFLKYPDFEQVAQNMGEKELTAMIASVEGFGGKTAGPVAAAMPAYYRFVQEIPADIYGQIRENRAGLRASADCGGPSAQPAPDKTERHPDIDGQNVCVTGFRDPEVERVIVRHGGTVQNAINSKTGLLVRINDEYTNSKTEAAKMRGIRIISKAEFEAQYS